MNFYSANQRWKTKIFSSYSDRKTRQRKKFLPTRRQQNWYNLS